MPDYLAQPTVRTTVAVWDPQHKEFCANLRPGQLLRFNDLVVLVEDVEMVRLGVVCVVTGVTQELPDFPLRLDVGENVSILEPFDPGFGGGPYWEGCSYCYDVKTGGGGMMPDHRPSKMCRSGGRTHCTCDTCF